MTYDIDNVRETFRANVLKALDKAASDTLGDGEFLVLGWVDDDLPALFASIERQIMRVVEREGVRLHDWRDGPANDDGPFTRTR